MSFTQIDNDLLDLLSPNEVLVYLAIKRHMPNAYPGLDRISALSGLSKRTVTRALSSLRDKGVLVWRRTGRTNIYLLTETMSSPSKAVEDVDPDHSEWSQWPIRVVTVAHKEEQDNYNKPTTSLRSAPASPGPQEEEQMIDWERPGPGTDDPGIPAKTRTRKPQATARIVKRDSMEFCMDEFQKGMLSLGIRLWNRNHMRRLLKTLHQDHTWEEISVLIREYVEAKGDEVRVRSKSYDPVVLFQQSLNSGFERMVLPNQGSDSLFAARDESLPGGRLISKFANYGKEQPADA